jgi:hypothetical protein
MSHVRSYLERPNSQFLDLDARYPNAEGKDFEKTMQKFKIILVLMTHNFEDVMCWVKSISGILAVFALYYILSKLGLLKVEISCPRL